MSDHPTHNSDATNNTHDSEIVTFKQAIKTGKRLMGLDFGSKTIGLAISDVRHTIATPVETIARTKFKTDGARLLSLIEEHDVVGLVLGLPVNMDGSEGARIQSTRAFARNLSGITDLPLMFWDERLSTVAVERVMIEADMSRQRRGELVDKMAATYILQGALDRLSHL